MADNYFHRLSSPLVGLFHHLIFQVNSDTVLIQRSTIPTGAIEESSCVLQWGPSFLSENPSGHCSVAAPIRIGASRVEPWLRDTPLVSRVSTESGSPGRQKLILHTPGHELSSEQSGRSIQGECRCLSLPPRYYQTSTVISFPSIVLCAEK